MHHYLLSSSAISMHSRNQRALAQSACTRAISVHSRNQHALAQSACTRAISMHSRNQHAGVEVERRVERTAIRSSAEAVRSRASACSTSTRTSRVLLTISSASSRSLSACHDEGGNRLMREAIS